MRRPLVGAAICATVALGVGSSAFAGEITGNGKPTGMLGNAKSACAFSGQEDNPDSPLRTQTPAEVWFDLDPDPANHFVLNPPPGAPAQPGNCNPTRP